MTSSTKKVLTATGDKPRVILSAEAYKKLFAYIDLVDTEITGFADVEYDKERNAFYVTTVYLLKQEAQDAEVDMDEDTIGEFLYECISMGMKQLPRLWWHSHATMSAFFSSIDDNTIENFSTSGWMLALVGNKSRMMKADLMIFEPYPIRVSDLPITFEKEKEEYPKELVDEVAAKVTQKKFSYTPTTHGAGAPYAPGWHNDDRFDDEDDPIYGKFGGHPQGAPRVGQQAKTWEPIESKEIGAIFMGFANGFATYQLPEDEIDAMTLIDDLDLQKEWDDDLSCYIYKNPDSKAIYVDLTGMFDDDDFLPIQGAKPQEGVVILDSEHLGKGQHDFSGTIDFSKMSKKERKRLKKMGRQD